MSTGSDLCQSFETCAVKLPDGRVKSYWDKIGQVWTIGWGSTGAAIGANTIWTQDQCDSWFMNRWASDRAGVLRASPVLSRPENANRLEAITCFAYNCGVGAYQTSTMRRKVNALDWTAASNEFPKWNKSKGKVVAGLVRRRAAERTLFLLPVASSPETIPLPPATSNQPATQAVQPYELGPMMQQFERMLADFLRQNRP